MIVTIAVVAFFVAALGALSRVLRGPTLADRMVALDVILVALMCTVAVTGASGFAGLLAVLAIVGFTATVAVARAIERQGGQP